MTTTVTVEAHCDENTEVLVMEMSESGMRTVATLQNGGRYVGNVYGNKQLTVGEFEKDKQNGVL
jgi:hypothetical protein